MTVDDNMVKLDAQAAFYELKQVLQALEARGFRPMILTHDNGMPDTLKIESAHPTTPEVDRIREQNRAARLAA